jgi:hypothetical protein
MNVSASAIVRLASLSLLLFSFIITPACFAQTSPSAGNATCKIDKSSATQTELAFYRDDFKKAADLAAADYKTDPKNNRSRQQIPLQSSQPENSATLKETGWSHTRSCSKRSSSTPVSPPPMRG